MSVSCGPFSYIVRSVFSYGISPYCPQTKDFVLLDSEPRRPLPGRAGGRWKVWWGWKLHSVSHTAFLSSELSSCCCARRGGEVQWCSTRGWMQMVYRHMIYSPETDKQVWQWIKHTWWLDNIDNIYTRGQRTFTKNIGNAHSMHDGSSLSRWTLLPVFFLLQGAVDSFPAGG